MLYTHFIKRTLDIVLSFIGILLFSPLLLLITLLVMFTSKGPAVFKQKRVGRNKKYFYIYKFRTMKITTPAECPTRFLDDPYSYITPIGNILRLLSLDELPQLFNILIGDMSIIGPRPVILKEYDLITERDKYGANDLRPGLTGWAQINGRDALTVSSKAKLDGDYVKNISFAFDFKCFIETFIVVLKRKGIVEGKHSSKAEEIYILDETSENLVVQYDISKETAIK